MKFLIIGGRSTCECEELRLFFAISYSISATFEYNKSTNEVPGILVEFNCADYYCLRCKCYIDFYFVCDSIYVGNKELMAVYVKDEKHSLPCDVKEIKNYVKIKRFPNRIF